VLIVQIALGVILGGSALLWMQRRAENRRKLVEARRKGEEFGDQLADAVREHCETYLAGLQERLMEVIDQRMATLGVFDDSVEEQQAGNRKELSELFESLGGVSVDVRASVERNLPDWMSVMETLRLRPLVDSLIDDSVAKWKTDLVVVATDRIWAAREASRLRGE
jgi:hypothetical protein